jgi:hypothetical protein
MSDYKRTWTKTVERRTEEKVQVKEKREEWEREEGWREQQEGRREYPNPTHVPGTGSRFC